MLLPPVLWDSSHTMYQPGLCHAGDQTQDLELTVKHSLCGQTPTHSPCTEVLAPKSKPFPGSYLVGSLMARPAFLFSNLASCRFLQQSQGGEGWGGLLCPLKICLGSAPSVYVYSVAQGPYPLAMLHCKAISS